MCCPLADEEHFSSTSDFENVQQNVFMLYGKAIEWCYVHLYLSLLVTCENIDGFIFKVGINVMPGEGIAPS